uniref:Universal stress protein n=1 Tax=Roseihalotalea indica TaxID=2867963 RepID=A0AA49JCD1_9BACT|nr:universal stress protein [Tunicatimonas sp. TK19036]
MDSFKNILVAVPASETYQPTIQYAMRMAQDLQIKLTIVLVYTSNHELQGEEPEDKAALVCQKKYVQKCFGQLRMKQLANTSLGYRMVSIDGPLCEAMGATAPVYRPDLIISAADASLPLQQLVRTVSIPLLLVPLQIKYHSIRHIGLAYDTATLPPSETMSFVRRLAKVYRADVEVVEVDQDRRWISPFTKRANVELDFLLKDVAHRFHHAYSQDDAVESIEHYTQQYSPDVLVMLARRQLPFQDSPADRHTIKMAKQATRPVLILKK